MFIQTVALVLIALATLGAFCMLLFNTESKEILSNTLLKYVSFYSVTLTQDKFTVTRVAYCFLEKTKKCNKMYCLKQIFMINNISKKNLTPSKVVC